MKKYFTLVFFLPLLVCAQNTEKEVENTKSNQLIIEGNIEGVTDNTVVSFLKNNLSLATAKIEANKFVLIAKVEQPFIFQLSFSGYKTTKDLFVSAGKIFISGNVSDIQGLQVSGSDYHNDFEYFLASFNPIFKRMSEVNQASQISGITDSMRRVYNNAKYDLEKRVDEFIIEKSSSPVSAFLLYIMNNNFQNDPNLETRFSKLKTAALDNEFAVYLKETIEASKIGAVGTEAIDFVQNDVDGKPIKLSSFRGKYVLIDFWASWCGPCRQENPNVVAAYQHFKDKNFTVLGVSLDRNKENWIKAIADDKLTWTQVSDLKFWSNEVAQKYKISSIPQNILVGPNGIIVAKNLRGEDLHTELQKLLK